ASFEPLDGRHVVAVVHDGERETRKDAAAVDVNGAGAALPVIAAFFRSEELELLAERVEQGGTCVDVEPDGPAVYTQRNCASDAGGRSAGRVALRHGMFSG